MSVSLTILSALLYSFVYERLLRKPSQTTSDFLFISMLKVIIEMKKKKPLQEVYLFICL